MDRREFMKVAGVTVAALAAGVASEDSLAQGLSGRPPRGTVAGHFALELDRVAAGWLHSAEGGHASADAVDEKPGAGQPQKKHIGGGNYEDITLTCGTGMSRGFYQWIKDTFDHKTARHNGAIIQSDYNHKEISRLEFNNALLDQIGFPALDAASKDACKMTIKLSPETTRFVSGPGAGSATIGGPGDPNQKQWLPSNFRLTIAGFEEACKRVNKVEPLTIKLKGVTNPVGQLRDNQQETASLVIPNLVITLPESDSQPLYKWHQDLVISGNRSAANQKSGLLEYLTPNLQEVLFTLSFKNLGIFKITPDKPESHSDSIRRVKAEMYCENILFDFKSTAWA